MSGYVIRRHEDQKFVAPPGNEHSYTTDLMKARRFSDRDKAKSECCGNESVIPVESLLQPAE